MEMKNQVMEDQTDYPFALLDEIVEVQLNPVVNSRTADIIESGFDELKDRFASQCHQIWAQLKSQIFYLASDEHIKITVDQYLSAINHLKKQLAGNLGELLTGPSYHSNYQILITLLEDLETSIRDRYPNYLTNFTVSQHPNKTIQRSPFKILCHLSGDQLGLVIKAADESRLIEARSLSLVYQTIVPFLSTKNKEELSWDAMRSSTYHPEEIDKITAIAALEKMISKIKQQ
jgi:hypothetical protein